MSSSFEYLKSVSSSSFDKIVKEKGNAYYCSPYGKADRTIKDKTLKLYEAIYEKCYCD